MKPHNDHPLVMALHAAISRRSWNEVERAANQIRDDRRIAWPDDTYRMPTTRRVFEIVLEAVNYDGADIDSLTVGEIRRALP
jgi:hypothetical protein